MASPLVNVCCSNCLCLNKSRCPSLARPTLATLPPGSTPPRHFLPPHTSSAHAIVRPHGLGPLGNLPGRRRAPSSPPETRREATAAARSSNTRSNLRGKALLSREIRREARSRSGSCATTTTTTCIARPEPSIRTSYRVAVRSTTGRQEPSSTEESFVEPATHPATRAGSSVDTLAKACTEANGVPHSRVNSECGAAETECAVSLLPEEPLPQISSASQRSPMEAAAGSENLVKAETDFFMFTGYLAKYMLVMLTSGAVLETFAELAGGGLSKGSVLWFCFLAGVFLGCMVGAGRVLEGYATCAPRNMVVTGSTRGLGKALAREFLVSGDNVVITSRSEAAVRSAVLELREDMAVLGRRVPMAALWVGTPAGQQAEGPGNRTREYLDGGTLGVPGEGAVEWSSQRIVGIACDVQDPEDVHALASLAKRELGNVNLWINNAGANSGFKPFMDSSADELKQVVGTNLVGSMLCTKEAYKLLKEQGKGGHIFNMEGAGSEGGATPRYAAYGSTKSALRQFQASLVQELKGSGIGIHTASPGMVLTDLLLTGSTLANKQAFNIVCEQPETVARALVPRMRGVRGMGKAVNYLTPPRIVLAIITAWLRRGRWFDEEGRAVYEAEADRLRALAQGQQRQRSLVAVAEALPSTAWVSLFTSSAIGVYLFCTSVGEWVG